jgi:hypothetical protein
VGINFFIKQSSDKVESEINKLSLLARQLYFEKNYTGVMAIAEALLKLPASANTLGQYFLALVLSRQGATQEQAYALHCNLAECPDPAIRAGAYLHLTSRQLYYQNIDEAFYLANKKSHFPRFVLFTFAYFLLESVSEFFKLL